MNKHKQVTFYVEEHPTTFATIDDEMQVGFPAEYVVCGDCRGTGKTYLGWSAGDQPAFTQEDFAEEGPEFVEDYFSGSYDRQCPECKGENVVLEIVERLFTEEQKLFWKLYQDHLDEMHAYDAECEAERRFGC